MYEKLKVVRVLDPEHFDVRLSAYSGDETVLASFPTRKGAEEYVAKTSNIFSLSNGGHLLMCLSAMTRAQQKAQRIIDSDDQQGHANYATKYHLRKFAEEAAAHLSGAISAVYELNSSSAPEVDAVPERYADLPSPPASG